MVIAAAYSGIARLIWRKGRLRKSCYTNCIADERRNETNSVRSKP